MLVIARIVERDLGGHRILHRDLYDVGTQHTLGDAPCLPGPPRLAEVGDMARAAHKPIGAYAQQVRRAGAKADAVDGAKSR